MLQEVKEKGGAGRTTQNETDKQDACFVSVHIISQNATECNIVFLPAGANLLDRLIRHAVDLFDHHVECAEYHQAQACDARRIWQELERLASDG